MLRCPVTNLEMLCHLSVCVWLVCCLFVCLSVYYLFPCVYQLVFQSWFLFFLDLLVTRSR